MSVYKDIFVSFTFQLFLTDFCDQKERRIGIGETFSVLDRQFRIEISKEGLWCIFSDYLMQKLL